MPNEGNARLIIDFQQLQFTFNVYTKFFQRSFQSSTNLTNSKIISIESIDSIYFIQAYFPSFFLKHLFRPIVPNIVISAIFQNRF